MNSPTLDQDRTTEDSSSKTDEPRPVVWLNGEIMDAAKAAISVYDKGVLYGDGCFEGIRVYNGRIFKLASHVARMFDSARRIRLVPPMEPREFEQAIRDTVAASGLMNAYVRPVFTRGVGTMGLNPFVCKHPTAFIIVDTIQIYPPALYASGMPVIIAEHPRMPMDCIDPAIKSCNYLNNILAKIEAVDAGVLEAVMLNAAGDVAECTGDNIFVIKDGVITTPPTAAGILHGITRRFVMEEVAPAIGHTIAEQRLTVDELLAADEVFLTGTAAEVIGVNKVDVTPIGAGNVGPITAAIGAEFKRRVTENAPED
jgi:branched-chain amino acid aminotransferase